MLLIWRKKGNKYLYLQTGFKRYIYKLGLNFFRAELQSNADRKESAFWINRQKAINKGFTAGFETQKNRLETVEDNVEMLTANFTGIIY